MRIVHFGLQAALVELQSQQLAWQRDNLSERLAALLEVASQASLNTSTKVPYCPTLCPSTASIVCDAVLAIGHPLAGASC